MLGFSRERRKRRCSIFRVPVIPFTVVNFGSTFSSCCKLSFYYLYRPVKYHFRCLRDLSKPSRNSRYFTDTMMAKEPSNRPLVRQLSTHVEYRRQPSSAPLNKAFDFPQCLVRLPSTGAWWPCFYLPTYAQICNVHTPLYEARLKKDPNNEKLKEEMRCTAKDGCVKIYKLSLKSQEPVWLPMGRTTEPIATKDVTEFMTFEDEGYFDKFQELIAAQKSTKDDALKLALEEFSEFRAIAHEQKFMAEIIEAPRHPAKPSSRTRAVVPAVTAQVATRPPADSATVVTAASEDPPAPRRSSGKKRSASRSIGASGKKRGRTSSSKKTTPRHPMTPKRPAKTQAAQEEIDDDSTPVTAHKRPPPPPHTATKFNREALEEAQRGPNDSSPRGHKVRDLGRRQVFPGRATETAVSGSTAIKTSLSEANPGTGESIQPASEIVAQEETEVPTEQLKAPAAASKEQQLKEPTTETVKPTIPTNAIDPFVQEQVEEEEDEAEPIKPVNFAGRTNRDKISGCLDALRKENEAVIGCRKIVTCKRKICEFLSRVFESRGKETRNGAPPFLYVCGAPGSGKSMSVEECGRLAQKTFLASREEFEAPPRIVYLNSSQLRDMSCDEAYDSTLKKASVKSEKFLKNNSYDQDERPVVVFVLDEIDYLVSTSSSAGKFTKSEQYLQKLIELARSKEHLVALVGISNSVENDSAKRLEKLGFPQANKIVFKTYDREDLMHITLSRIGDTVVESKAIDFLARRIGSTSGDARKHLDILARSLSDRYESMAEDQLNALHEGPLVKLSHLAKICNRMTPKPREEVSALPTMEKHLLCLCIYLAPRVVSKPMPLKKLLTLFREVYPVVELDEVSSLSSLLERLVDTGLLQLKVASLASGSVVFDEQLDEVETAVRERLMIDNFYVEAKTRLDARSCHYESISSSD